MINELINDVLEQSEKLSIKLRSYLKLLKMNSY